MMFNEQLNSIMALDEIAMDNARARWDMIAKPIGILGVFAPITAYWRKGPLRRPVKLLP